MPLSTPEIIAISTAVSGAISAIVVKVIDSTIAKRRLESSSALKEQHQFIEDNADFRQELRDDMKDLRERTVCLEKKLDLTRKEKLLLEEELARLRGENDALRTDVRKLRERNEFLERDRNQLTARVAELEAKMQDYNR